MRTHKTTIKYKVAKNGVLKQGTKGILELCGFFPGAGYTAEFEPGKIVITLDEEPKKVGG
ncbi:MAG: hypothetical protein GY861_13875 [bacterium]|nr:hypothetical protein [bacterium]